MSGETQWRAVSKRFGAIKTEEQIPIAFKYGSNLHGPLHFMIARTGTGSFWIVPPWIDALVCDVRSLHAIAHIKISARLILSDYYG
jgi:hypothetical protein